MRNSEEALRDDLKKLQSEMLQLDQQLVKLTERKSPQAEALLKKRASGVKRLISLQRQLTYFSSPLSEGYRLLNYEDFKNLTPVQKLEVVKGMHDIVYDAHQCGLMLNDLGLERFGIKSSQDGHILVQYQGNADSIAHHQGHEATLLAKADIFFLGETFKKLNLSPKLTSLMTTTDPRNRVTDEQIAHKFDSLMPNQPILTPPPIEKERQVTGLDDQNNQHQFQNPPTPNKPKRSQ
ncbi:MAG: hypothetical protein U1E78_08595 [Gammaproteobacteria bacterium]